MTALLTSPLARKLVLLVGILAIIGLAWAWIDHNAYQRAERDRDLAAAVDAIEWTLRVEAIEDDLAERLDALDRQLADRDAAIDATADTEVNPVIEEEIADDPSLHDPRRGINDELLRAINAARAASARPAGADRGAE